MSFLVLLLILLMIGVYHYFRSNTFIRKKIIYWLLTFLPAFGMIISFHLVSLLYTLSDFPRTNSLFFTYPSETILKSYFWTKKVEDNVYLTVIYNLKLIITPFQKFPQQKFRILAESKHVDSPGGHHVEPRRRGQRDRI